MALDRRTPTPGSPGAIGGGTFADHVNEEIAALWNGTTLWLTSVAGVNTITANVEPALDAYVRGQGYWLVPAETNTDDVVLNIGGRGDRDVVDWDGAALASGALLASRAALLVYDGSDFRILSGGALIQVLAGFNLLGAWSGATTYAVGDIVSEAGSSYIAKLAHTNQQPPNSTYWQLLVSALIPATEQQAKDGTNLAAFMPSGRVRDAIRADGILNVKAPFGAAGDFNLTSQTGADDTQAFLDAIDAAKEAIAAGHAGRPPIVVPPGNYRLTEQLDFDDFGLLLIGRGNVSSRLIFDHDGIGARFYRSESGARGIGFLSSDARIALAADIESTGVLVLGPAAATQNANVNFDECTFNDQPGCGLLHIGSGFRIAYCQARNNKIHGIANDTGNILAATALIAAGDIEFQGFGEIIRPITTGNGGHGIAVGHPDDTSAKSIFRTRIHQQDAGGNATDAAVRYTEDDNYLVGVGIEGHKCVGSGVAGTAAGYTVGGIGTKLLGHRYVAGLYVARVLQIAGLSTAAVKVEIDTIVSSADTPLDPAVLVDASVPVTSQVDVLAPTGTNITTTKTAGWAGVSRISSAHEVRGGRSTFASLGGTMSIGTIGDDAFKKLEFNAELTGMAMVWSETSQGRAALVHFHVGGTPFCVGTEVAPAGEVDFTTGALTGTTGTDTDVTISAHTDNCLYIENRTGSARVFNIMLFGSLSSMRIIAIT